MRESFLQLLLEMEVQSGNSSCNKCGSGDGQFQCSNCIGDMVHCRNCLMESHKLLPFHRIKMWNGKYFVKTTLRDQGFIIHLGHHGQMCSDTEDLWMDIFEDAPIEEDIDLLQDQMDGKMNNVMDDTIVNIVHTTGVFKHKVRWCRFKNAPEKTVQLFQMQLFPASHLRPETAFTFDVLDNFHIDAMECKTAAASFMKKLCRLTNNTFPHTVPVSFTFLPAS